MPNFLFAGEEDRTTPTSIVAEYFPKIRAPPRSCSLFPEQRTMWSMRRRGSFWSTSSMRCGLWRRHLRCSERRQRRGAWTHEVEIRPGWEEF